MAGSAWGRAWGKAWGHAWGSLDGDTETPVVEESGGAWLAEYARAYRRQIEQESAEALAAAKAAARATETVAKNEAFADVSALVSAALERARISSLLAVSDSPVDVAQSIIREGEAAARRLLLSDALLQRAEQSAFSAALAVAPSWSGIPRRDDVEAIAMILLELA